MSDDSLERVDDPQVSGDNQGLVRGIGLPGATVLNMIDMIGVGPFITFPQIIAVMHGPQAMLGWIIGAVIVMCDGLVWAELGAALPQSGGPFNYLREIYGRESLGRYLSFLFIWQLSFSAPLSIASGSLGFSEYASYTIPALQKRFAADTFGLQLPLLGKLEVSVLVSGATFVAIGACLFIVFLLYRRITLIERVSKFLWVGVMLTIAWVIYAGLTHFSFARAFDFPPGAFELKKEFFLGLGSALLIAFYDYFGYYNVCFLGGEVRQPERNIPRAIIISILSVACIYIVMNISILGVIPWREFVGTADSDARKFVISAMMERLYGTWAGVLAAVLVMWTAFSSVFSLLLGYSRVPYAAALDGNYFKIFARLHPRNRFPYISLLVMGGVAALFSFLRLADVIAALVVIRIFVQFIAQIVGVMIFRRTRPDIKRPFKMWLYPLPALVALTGFIYVLFSRPNFQKEIRYATLLVIIGTVIYLVRSYRRGEWPFHKTVQQV